VQYASCDHKQEKPAAAAVVHAKVAVNGTAMVNNTVAVEDKEFSIFENVKE
jgi:hypothetical protein